MAKSESKLEFTVYGEPVAKGRPRVATIGGKARAYTPAKTAKAERDFRAQAIKFKPDKPVTGPVWIQICVYRDLPKSFSNKKREAALNWEVLPVTRPDCDNYGKLVLDAMNQIFFADDSQVVGLEINKFYSDQPRIWVGMVWKEDNG